MSSRPDIEECKSVVAEIVKAVAPLLLEKLTFAPFSISKLVILK